MCIKTDRLLEHLVGNRYRGKGQKKKKRLVVLSDVDKSERIQVEREFIEEVDEEEEAEHPALK